MSHDTILAIDAGNTRIKWGCADSNGWVRRGALATAEVNQLGVALQGLPAPQRIIAANVAGESVRASLTQALAAYGVAPLWVRGREQQCGVKCGYADPAQLGPDRWAGLIAAWKLQARACVVVNAGTTLTVDALSHEGVFLGGIIVPGLELMRTSLDRGTAQLKLQQGAFGYFPDNTADAIMSGAVNALTGAIDRLRGYMAETGQGVPLVVLSGGAAAVLAPRLTGEVALVDNLVLEGLLVMAGEGG